MTTEAHDEIVRFFQRCSAERAEFEEKVRTNIDELRESNAENRLRAQRDLDDHYRNYIIPV